MANQLALPNSMLKVPPHNVDAEVALLGALFVDPKIVARVKSQISPNDFYREAHVEIYKAFLEVKEPDAVTISAYLSDRERLEKVGGVAYLTNIISSAFTAQGFQGYLDIIKEYSTRRKIITGCSVVMERAFSNSSVLDLASELKAVVRNIQTEDVTDITDNKTILQDEFLDIERRSKEKDHKIGLDTGFYDLDRHIGGLEPETLIYIIARPSIGKTALSLAIAENIAQAGEGLVVFYSLEMGKRQIVRRRLAAKSNVFLSRIRHGDIEDYQWDHLVSALNVLSESQMLIVDRPKYKTFENIISLTEGLAVEKKIACVFIDHIQLVRSKKKFGTRHAEISHISSGLKDLAKEIHVPVIALCQLSREIEKRTNKRPRLEDMKESGDLEQDADIVIGIYRENKDAESMELCGLKGRDIGTWETSLEFDKFTQRIT